MFLLTTINLVIELDSLLSVAGSAHATDDSQDNQ